MHTLVVIDIQNDFIPGGSLAVPEGDQIIPVVNRILYKFDLVVATQDWHPQNHISFASNHHGNEAFDSIQWHGMEQVLWPDHCVQNSKGAGFHPDLDMSRVEAIFRKGMDPQIDSYSGFYDNGHEKNTGMAGYLRERYAEHLFFCGLAADFCVRFSIQDALQEGFSTTLIEDATRPIDAQQFETIRSELIQDGCQVIRSNDL